MRTNDSDYATVPFVAEITLTLGGGGTAASSQQVFFGMGSGDTALFGVPDWSTLLASTFVSARSLSRRRCIADHISHAKRRQCLGK